METDKMNTKITGSITVNTVIWHCNDKRLPLNKDIKGPPPTENMLETLQEIQLHEVGVVQKGKQFFFRWGTRRLKAIRQLFEEGKHNGDIRILLLTGIDPEDSKRLSLIENDQRSPNEVNTWQIIREMLYAKPVDGNAPTYKSISDYTGITIGEIKALERKWGTVPVWSINAVARGDIAPSTAIAVGKLSRELQKECKTQLETTKKLSAVTVKAKREFVRTEAYGAMIPGLNLPVVRDYYTRQEVEAIQSYLATNRFDDVKIYVDNLLSE